VAKQPMKDLLIVIQDTGMRPEEVFRIRIEHIDWSQRLIFNPNGKTKAACRYAPISERMVDLLMVRCADKREGWLLPSRRAKGRHLTTVAKQFRDARRKAGLPGALVLYCARHTFGTAAYGAAGNLAMVCVLQCGTSIRCWILCAKPSIREIESTSQTTSQWIEGAVKWLVSIWKNGADERTWTADLPITNRLLYQLSYVGFWFGLFSLPNCLVASAVQPLYKRPETPAVSWGSDDSRHSFDVAALSRSDVLVPEYRLDHNIRNTEFMQVRG
jgi:hypothetical protein